MTKEEFKQLRAEAGFKTDAEFAKALNIHPNNINSWNTGQNPYPKYLKNILFLFKMNNDFDEEKYEEFLMGLMPKQKSPKKYRVLLKEASVVLENQSLEELEKENTELKVQLEFLIDLVLD